MIRLNRVASLDLVVLSFLVHLSPAKAQTEVDLTGVLAVDISNSLDLCEGFCLRPQQLS